ncbi:MAG TPA: ion transporter [Nitrospinota bacterium]|nr:ion transporter [Nitrospinota bacterium]
MTYTLVKNKVNRIMNDRMYTGKRYFDLFMMVLIIFSVSTLLMELESGRTELWRKFNVAEDTILVIFIIEYLMRLWVCSDIRKDFKKTYRLHHGNLLFNVINGFYVVTLNKLRWMIKPMSVIDLLAILPMFRVFRAFRIFRLLRLFKLVRYSQSMESLFMIFRENASELGMILAFISLIVIVSSTFIFILEKGVPTGSFESLGDALWWSFVTITTVGYGDKVPSTDVGRVLAVFLMLSAIVAIALPSGVLASAMTQKFIAIKEGRLNMKKFKNHLVICGWNNSAEQLMKEFEKHHQNQKWDVVAITLKSSDEIDNDRVILKRGDFTKEGVLNDVNIADANSVIVVAEELRGISDESVDARSFLACNLIHSINPDVYVIVQLLNTENAKLLKNTIKDIEIIISDDITGGLLSNSIVNRGTSKLINTLLIQNQENIKKIPLKKIKGSFKTFNDLFSFCRLPSCNWLPLALERNGELFINPKDDFELTDTDNLFCIQTEIEM